MTFEDDQPRVSFVKQERQRWWWLIGLPIALLIMTAAFCLDPLVRTCVTEHQNSEWSRFMHYVSDFGDWMGLVVIFLAGFLMACGLASRHWQRMFVTMLVACALAGIVARGVKIVTGRTRPSVQSEHTWNAGHWSSKYHAFPSGHTAAATAFFGALFLVHRRLGAPFLIIPALIGLSRLYVGAHYLSDVIGAAFLGIISAIVVVRWLSPPIEDRKSKIEN